MTSADPPSRGPAGAWLAPVRVVGVSIAGSPLAYLPKVAAKMREHGIRMEADEGADAVNRRIQV